jgi:hypothetical protein
MSSGDNATSSGINQSNDYKKNVEPALKKITTLLLDVIFNGSKSPLDERLGRLSDSGKDIEGAIKSLCKKDRSAQCTELSNNLN